MVAPTLIPHIPDAAGQPGTFGSGTFGSGTFGGGGSAVTASSPPWVEVLFSGLPSNAASLNIVRTVGTRTHKVRGGVNVYCVGGAATIADYECPFGVDAAYQAEMFDSDGVSLGFTGSSTIRLSVSQTWIHNPLDPGAAVTVRLTADTASQVSQPTLGTIYTPPGSLGILIAGGRVGVTGVPLNWFTDDLATADQVEAMLGDPGQLGPPPVLCVRVSAAATIRLPRPFFAAVTNPVENPVNLLAGGTRIRFTSTATEVQPPLPGVVQAVYTLGDLDSNYALLGDLDSAYKTLLDIDRAYGIAGSAQVATTGAYGSGSYGDGAYGG